VHNCPLLLKVWAPPRHGSPVTHCVKCARGNSLNTIDATKGEVHLSHCRSTGDIHRGFRSGPTTGRKTIPSRRSTILRALFLFEVVADPAPSVLTDALRPATHPHAGQAGGSLGALLDRPGSFGGAKDRSRCLDVVRQVLW
jgi:hypothetical protein